MPRSRSLAGNYSKPYSMLLVVAGAPGPKNGNCTTHWPYSIPPLSPDKSRLLLQTLERRTIRKVSWRLLPLIVIIYFVAYIDRTNVSFAALTMNKDLGLSP